MKEIFKPPTKKQEKDANDKDQEAIIKEKKEEERYNIMTQKEKNLYNLYNSSTPYKKN